MANRTTQRVPGWVDIGTHTINLQRVLWIAYATMPDNAEILISTKTGKTLTDTARLHFGPGDELVLDREETESLDRHLERLIGAG